MIDRITRYLLSPQAGQVVRPESGTLTGIGHVCEQEEVWMRELQRNIAYQMTGI